MIRMCNQLKHIIFMFVIVIAAAQMAIADPVTVELAENTPTVDPGDPTLAGPPPTTTTTTTTTTTIPTIPPCPNSLAGATKTSQDGYKYWDDYHNYFSSIPSQAEYDYWKFETDGLCGLPGYDRIYCFENPYVDASLSNPNEQQMASDLVMFPWPAYFDGVLAGGKYHPDTCFICGCFRDIGCFAPGVKITMADGSLRKIEDVRAGDLVRNAKTGDPMKVGKVIEGPEALPLIRFGFDGTTVTTSQAHPVLTAAGLKPANKLKKGDTVFDAQGNPHPLTILETLPLEEGQHVINVKLDAGSSDADERLIVSDGIITGDIVLQGLLKEHK